MTDGLRLPRGVSDPAVHGDSITANVSFPLDAEGYFGRECNEEGCKAYFKILASDYPGLPQTGSLTCPSCGVTNPMRTFWTQDQLERRRAAARELGLQYVRGLFGEMLEESARRSNGFMTYTPGTPRMPRELPEYLEQETIRTFACPRCSKRAVVYDALVACPSCGPDTPARAILDDTLQGTRRMLSLLDHVPIEHRAELKAFGGERKVAERALGAGVAGVAAFAKQVFEASGASTADRNPWQNPDRLQAAWKSAFGKDPLDGIDAASLATIRLGYARRHILEHNAGKADEKYIRESGEAIAVGRQPRYGADFARSFVDALPALADRLNATARTVGAPPA